MKFFRRMRKGLSEPPMSEAVASATTLDRRTEVMDAKETACAAEVARKIIPFVNEHLEMMLRDEGCPRAVTRHYKNPHGYKSQVEIYHLGDRVVVKSSVAFRFLPDELEAEYGARGYRVEVRRGEGMLDRLYAVDISPVLE